MSIFTRTFLAVWMLAFATLAAAGVSRAEKNLPAMPENGDPAHSGSPAIVFVASGGTGNGMSWTNAAGDLWTVLDTAATGTIVWVKEGTYFPTTCSDCGFTDRNRSFRVRSGVKLYGGFAGTETAIDQRDITAHPTYLSGDIDGDLTRSNNSFTIIYTKNASPETLVDGFIITGGNADDPGGGLGSATNSGGGWYNDGSGTAGQSHPVAQNCIFENNYAWGYGGGMCNNGGFSGSCDPGIFNCIFRNNTSYFGGGALYNTGNFEGSCNPVIADCRFENNECEQSDGGALFNTGSEGGVCSPEITGCDFTGNRAGHDGGAMFNFGKGGTCSPVSMNCLFGNNEGKEGGAVYNDGTFDGYNTAAFYSCRFTGNYAFNGDGAAMYNSSFYGTCNPVLSGCDFENNNSTFAGGAIFNNGVEGVCSPVITHCRFLENVADTYGGALYNQGKNGHSSPAITNCLFYKNTALSAGAVYNLGAENGHADAQIINCTFYGNNADVGGAVYCNAGEMGTGTCSPAIANCIFQNNTAADADAGDIFRIIWGTPVLSFSLLDKPDCEALYSGNGGQIQCLDGIIFDEEPLFTDPMDGDFHLLDHSPAIDAGNNDFADLAGLTTDLDNLPRIHNGTVDLGVFEYGAFQGGPPVISQQPLSRTACEGETVQFSVDATGNPPLSYQWFHGNQPVAGAVESNLTLDAVSLSDEGSYYCLVTGSMGQETQSQPAQLTVLENLTVSLAIDQDGDLSCEGDTATFTATALNGGANPVFSWQVNGSSEGGNASVLQYLASDGDEISCLLTSSETCVTGSPAVSDTVAAVVLTWENVTIEISASEDSTFCTGTEVIFSASVEHGGTSPVYEWMVNGMQTGSNAAVFAITTLEDDDAVSSRLTSSRACVAENTVSSNSIVVSVDSCLTDTREEIKSTADIRIYPNPADNKIVIEIYELSGNFVSQLLDARGQVLMSGAREENTATPYTRTVDVSDFPGGVYYYQIISNQEVATKRFVVH